MHQSDRNSASCRRLGNLLPGFLLAAACLVTSTAHAQDFTTLLKGAVLDHVPAQWRGAIASFTDVVQGQLDAGVAPPADAQGRIVMYETARCGYCKRAAAHMKKKNIAFVARDIETNPAYRAEYDKLGGKGGVPYIVFGDKTLYGFSEGAFDQHYAHYQRTRPAKDSAQAANSDSDSAAGGSGLQAGDALISKIAGTKIYADAKKSAPRIAALAKSEEMVYMGEERAGRYRVTSAQGEGWVDKMMVKKP